LPIQFLDGLAQCRSYMHVDWLTKKRTLLGLVNTEAYDIPNDSKAQTWHCNAHWIAILQVVYGPGGPKAIAPERWTKRQSSIRKALRVLATQRIWSRTFRCDVFPTQSTLRRQALVAKRQQRRWMGRRVRKKAVQSVMTLRDRRYRGSKQSVTFQRHQSAKMALQRTAKTL
jgi:hypothetical protein